MLSKTKKIKNDLYFIKDYENKISFLKDKYKGENCFIIAPGPSSKNPQISSLRTELENNLVFCVKGIYSTYKEFCDFHFFNDCNLPYNDRGVAGYQYDTKNDPIVIASSGFTEDNARKRVGSQRWDIFCRVLDPALYPGEDIGYILENLRFEAGIFDTMCQRPCGPGIVLETVIYMALHVGVKNIFAIGLDGGTKFTSINNIYNKNLHLDTHPRTQKELQFKNWEIEITTNGTGPLCDWLGKKGINLFLVSEESKWNQKIPRLSSAETKTICDRRL